MIAMTTLETLASSSRGVPGHPDHGQQFPLDALPVPVANYCLAVALARSVDVAVPAALSLAAMGSAIGLSREAYDSFADWREPPVIWVAQVMRSGQRKTPVQQDMFAAHLRLPDLTFEELGVGALEDTRAVAVFTVGNSRFLDGGTQH